MDGDEGAFTKLVKKHQKSVHALAWRKVEDFHVAEEITQDVFVKVYHKLSTLKNPSQFSGWLAVMTHRHCIAWHRENRVPMQSLEAMEPVELEEHYYTEHLAAERRAAALCPGAKRTNISNFSLHPIAYLTPCEQQKAEARGCPADSAQAAGE